MIPISDQPAPKKGGHTILGRHPDGGAGEHPDPPGAGPQSIERHGEGVDPGPGGEEIAVGQRHQAKLQDGMPAGVRPESAAAV